MHAMGPVAQGAPLPELLSVQTQGLCPPPQHDDDSHASVLGHGSDWCGVVSVTGQLGCCLAFLHMHTSMQAVSN